MPRPVGQAVGSCCGGDCTKQAEADLWMLEHINDFDCLGAVLAKCCNETGAHPAIARRAALRARAKMRMEDDNGNAQ